MPQDPDDPNRTIRPDAEDGSPASGLLDEIRLLPPSSELALGNTIGRGGMGIVRAADQRTLGRTVAIKSLRDEHHGPAAIARLVEEAWVTGALEHPNIVPIYDILRDEMGSPHIVLKRIEGTPWTTWIGDPEGVRAQFAVEDVLGWHLGVLIGVCNAIGFAHSREIVHRDLKPSNVMIGRFGEVYVLDWGIAAYLGDAEHSRLPAAADQRRIAGTPRYMAPEMVGGDGRLLSSRTDVYQLGGLLHQILSGLAPHRGWGTEEILLGIPDFEPSLPDAPPELADLVHQAMRPDPADRLPSAEAFRTRVQGYLEHRGSSLLAEKAVRSLETLRRARAQPADEERRRVLYDAFAACRFGFRAALEAWPENPAAQRGLQEALIEVIGFELDQGDDRSVQILWPELTHVDPGLEERLAEVRAKRVHREQALQSFQRDHDPGLDVRARTLLVVCLGTIWVLAPAVIWMTSGFPSATSQIARSSLQLVGVTLFVLWAQRSMTPTIANRNTLALLLAMTLTQLVLQAGMAWIEVPRAIAAYAQLMMYGCWAGAAAVAVDRRLVGAAAAYILCFAGATLSLEHTMAWTAVGNVALTASIAAIWLPGLRD